MKGQYFSFDAIIGAVIFVLAMVALLSYWHSIRSFLDYQNDPLSRDAVRVSNLLFTPPSPSENCTMMNRLGFARSWEDKRAEESVIACAQGQTQNWLRQGLGTPYGVSIKITNLATNAPPTVIGGDVPADALNVVKIRRLATVVNETNGTYLASVDLSLYR
jgi:hypothetical protein